MRGDIVIVRDVEGQPLVRKVWDASEDGVYIHSDEEWTRRLSGEAFRDPVFFPAEDVFQYDEKAKRALDERPVEWKDLVPYRAAC